MNDINGSGGFFADELSNLTLKDKRLINRAKVIGTKLLRSPGSCIQEVFSCQNSARCAYDFFSNVKVSWDKLFCCHQEKTVSRVEEANDNYILHSPCQCD